MSSDSHQPASVPNDRADVKLVLWVAGAFVFATVTLTFIQVLLRTVFNNPQAWAEEVSRYLFAWIVFLGAAVCFARDTHIRVDFVDGFFSERAMVWVRRLRDLTSLCAAAVMLYAGVLVAWRNRDSMFYTVPGLPQVLFYLSVPLSGALIVIFVLRQMVKAGKSGTTPTLGSGV